MKHALSLVSFLFSLSPNTLLLVGKVFFFDGLVRTEAHRCGNMLPGISGYKGMRTVTGVTSCAGFVAGMGQVDKDGVRVFMS